jgi:hypothetical protein
MLKRIKGQGTAGHNRKGSIFLLVLTSLTVLFVLGMAMTFFTGAEDYSSAMSYESEVAFALAESAIEEFVARLKGTLNNDDPTNALYSNIRDPNRDVKSAMPIAPNDVVALTSFTRESARNHYGMQFGHGLSDSKDFNVTADIKLQHIKGVNISDNDTKIYEIREVPVEKQGELTVVADVKYKGHGARVTLTCLIRVVKTFVPPFNYFTLFVRDASAFGGSNFNTFVSTVSNLEGSLRLDNGWQAVEGKDFDPVNDLSWEKKLAVYGNEAHVPPGRVYLGQDLETLDPTAPAVHIRATNGAKLLYKNIDTTASSHLKTRLNARDGMYLNFDVWWMNFRDYAKKVMEIQGQTETKTTGGGFLSGLLSSDKTEVRVINVGAGGELSDMIMNEPPSFVNCFTSLVEHTKATVEQIDASSDFTAAEKDRFKILLPGPEYSGFAPFGAAIPNSTSMSGGSIQLLDTNVDFKKLSPTLIYGPAMRKYFRAVQIKTEKTKEEVELPYVAPEHFEQLVNLGDGPAIKEETVLKAEQAQKLFRFAQVPEEHIANLIKVWDELPDGLKRYDRYREFMSGEGGEPINNGLGHFINRVRGVQGKYEGDLKNHMGQGRFLESSPYPFGPIPSGMDIIVERDVTREFYEGPLFYALPNDISTYLMDFYFIPRSTEDFFRGRTTIAIGGETIDRFPYKYINDVARYSTGSPNETLQLNGILTLNDSTLLELNNLKFRGKGVIYSSPMMGGGKILINGDLVGVDSDVEEFSHSIGENLLTLVAPQIIINTDQAQSSTCYVEANLISLSEPLQIIGTKPAVIKGSVVTPTLNLQTDFRNLSKNGGENVIIYNPLNSIWRNERQDLRNSMYIAKIVTGGVGKFDWKYERPND